MATAESVKAKLQGLIDAANVKTGNNDADLTTAVNNLVGGYGVVDVDSLPTEDIKEGVVYKLNTTIEGGGETEVYVVADFDGDGTINVMTLAEMMSSVMNVDCTVNTQVVETLPEELETSSVVSGGNVYLYVVESTGVVYGDLGTGAMTLGLGIFEAEGYDKGWSTDINSETEMGCYAVGSEKISQTIYTYHTYENGQLKEISGGDVVDLIHVEELPTQDIDERAMYHLTKTEIVDVYACGNGLQWTLTHYLEQQGFVSVNMHYYLVDELPEIFETTILDTSTGSADGHVYVLKENGQSFMSIDGSTFISVASFDNTVDNGWADSTTDMANVGTYTLRKITEEYLQYQDGELKKAVLRDDVVYKTTVETDAGVEMWLVVYDEGGNIKMPVVDFFAMQGVSVSLKTYIVDELPETMEPMDEATLTVPLYVMRDTGVAYISQDGTSASAVTAGTMFDGLPDMGWAEDIESITPLEDFSNSGVYSVMKEASVSHTLYLYTDGKLVPCGAGGGGLVKVEELPTENIDEDAVYTLGVAEVKDILIGSDSGEPMSMVDLLKALGFTVNFYIVSELPSSLAKIDNTNKIYPFYVLESTGYVYVSNDGVTATSPGTQYGWISNALQATAKNTYYTLGGAGTAYGIPNSTGSKQIWEHDGTEWTQVNATVPLTVTENGVYTPPSGIGGFSDVTVEIDGSISLQSKTATKNNQTIVADSGYDGLSQVTVNLPLQTKTVTQNGAIVADSGYEGLKQVNVDVPYATIADNNGVSADAMILSDDLSYLDNYAFKGVQYGSCPTFNGTVSEWEAIPKADSWDADSDVDCIICSDGYIQLRGKELTYQDNGTYYTVTDAPTNITNAVIPSFYNGKPVTRIGDNAFENCTNLKSVKIPRSITTIGSSAFKGCVSLTGVIIPEGVQKINNSAFSSCNNMQKIVIPSSLTYIGADAFYACWKLDTYVADANAWVKIQFYRNSNAYYCYPNYYGNLYFLDSNGNEATEIIIPDSVTSLGDYLFKGCKSHVKVTVHDNITSVGTCTFDECDNLVFYEHENGCYLGNDANNYIIFVRAKDKNITTCDIHSNTKLLYKEAFKDCKLLTEVNIPNGITVIPQSTFSGCTNLKSITIPDSVTSIGSSVFVNCKGLESVVIGNGITTITRAMFSGCDNLSNVTIPESVTSIQSYVFENCTNLKSVTIPNSVTNIGQWAFADSGLESITIPNSVEVFGSNNYSSGVFSGCTNLKSVMFESGSKIPCINSSAFYGCYSLVSISLPEGITSIGSYAFRYCHNLVSVEIPSTVTYISSDYVFEQCYKLTEIINHSSVTVSSGLESHTGESKIVNIDDYLFYTTEDGTNYLISYIGDEIELTLPNDYNGETYQIRGYAFIGDALEEPSPLRSVIIPNNVTSIGNSAFAWCDNLESVIIPDSVTSMGYYTFRYCGKLKSVVIGNGLTQIPMDAFQGCGALTHVTLGNNVSSIFNSFEGCSSLMSITIPASVALIYSDSFKGCEKLVEVINHSSLNIIAGTESNGYVAYNALEVHSGESKIQNQNGYLFYTYNGTNYLLGYDGDETELILPDNYNGESYQIYDYAFQNCTNIKSVTIPSGISSIGSYIFSGCSDLDIYITDVSMWANSQQAVVNNSYVHILDSNGNEMTSLVIPQDVTSIGSGTFCYCKSITSVTIPNSVTSIGESVFRYCDNLTTVNFDENSNIASIGGYVFENCGKLTDIAIPNSVTSIGNHVFHGCTSLKGDVFDENSNITSIGSSLFNGCSSLTSVTIPKGVTDLGWDTFSDCTSLTSVFIPDGVTNMGQRTFKNCSALTSITIPSSMTHIDAVAFEDCSALTSVYINDIASWCALSAGHTSNPLYYATTLFVDNKRVVNLVIPEGVTSIGNYAFYGCEDIHSVVIPASVTSIGSNAFYGCSNLESVTILGEVTSIGSNAFQNCNKLAKVVNYSSLPITMGSTSNGYIGNYASYVMNNDYCFQNIDGTIYLYSYMDDEAVLTLPDSYNGGTYQIYDYAFNGCAHLTNVTIPDGITTIPSGAFNGCIGLSTITIPNTVTQIKELALNNCLSLTDITYNGTKEQWRAITLIDTWDNNTGDYIITCTDGMIRKDGEEIPYVLTYTLNDDGASYSVSDAQVYTPSDIVIPAEYEGLPVTSVGNSAFSGCSNLTGINIPDSVTSIGQNAFYYCSKLISVVIPNSVTSIGENAFCGCNKLTDVTIPDGVVSIGGWAFMNCDLTSITIPSSVTYIADRSFGGNSRATTIMVSTGNTVYHSDGNCIIHTANKRLISGCINSVIPTDGSVTSIGDGAFYNKALISVAIPDGVTSIEETAFGWNSDLISVTIPYGVTSIESYAFDNCYRLSDVVYTGSKEQWNTIAKAGTWDSRTPDYTIYCTDGTIAKDGTETSYPTLSGSWLFNSTLTTSDSGINESVTTDKFTNIFKEEDELYYTLNGTTTMAYDFAANTWVDDSYRSVTFDGAQVVSDEFYNWFTANAVSLTVNGVWQFNDTLTKPSSMIDQRTNIQFETESGTVYTTLEVLIDSTALYYVNKKAYDFDTQEWTQSTYKTITFLEDTVASKEFYEWLTANATKKLSLGGTWVFNDSVDCTNASFVQNIDFADTEGGNAWTAMHISSDGVVYAGVGSEMISVYSNGSWSETWAKRVEFAVPQEVSQDFYDWFVANATKQ